MDVTETADLLGEKDELGKQLDKMTLVTETVVPVLKLKRQAQPSVRIPSGIFSPAAPCSFCLPSHWI